MTDIRHKEDGDIDFDSGDVSYADSEHQHQKDILLSQKGYYKEYPVCGVDILNYVNESNPEELLRTIRKEFVADGMKVTKVSLTVLGDIETDACYEDS